MPGQVNPGSLAVAGGERLYTLTQDFQKLWPEDSGESSLSVLTELTPGGGPLSTNNQARLLARGPFPSARFAVELTNSVLIFADEPDGVTIASVWRRP